MIVQYYTIVVILVYICFGFRTLFAHCMKSVVMDGPHIQIEVDWTLKLTENDCEVNLGLVCVLCISGDLIYIFANHPLSTNAVPVIMLPQPIQELLLFEPIVPLRYTSKGFQSLLPSEWEAMSAQNDSYVGLNTWSSNHESCESSSGSLSGEENDGDEYSISSNEDIEHANLQVTSDEDVIEDIDSEGSCASSKKD